MNVSQKSHYAILALMALAREGDRPLPISRIAQFRPIPSQFLHIILRELRQGGFVRSLRGTQGGFLLARPADAITAGDVVRFVDGGHFVTQCAQPDYQGPCLCSEHCALQEIWCRISRLIAQELDRITIAELTQRDRVLRPGSPGDFAI